MTFVFLINPYHILFQVRAKPLRAKPLINGQHWGRGGLLSANQNAHFLESQTKEFLIFDSGKEILPIN